MAPSRGRPVAEHRLTLEVRGSPGSLEVEWTSAKGRDSAPFDPPFGPEELPRLLGGAAADVLRESMRIDAAAGAESPDRDTGELLFTSLFAGRGRRHLDQCLGGAGRVVLDLRFDGLAPELRWLACLPWELLKDPEEEHYLCAGRRVSLVRTLRSSRGAGRFELRLPLRIAVVAPQPTELMPLDLERERRLLDDALREAPDVEMEFLQAVEPQRVREALLEGGYQALHFMGHGELDPATGLGSLWFGAPDGHGKRVGGPDLERWVLDLDLGFVFLNACQSGRFSERAAHNPYAGVAPALVAGGVPAVLAMQRPVSDKAAILFGSVFYRRLVDEDPLDVAFNEARLALAGSTGLAAEWATPVLLAGHDAGRMVQVALPPAEQAFRAARAALLAGNLAVAAEALQRTLAARPSHANARVHWCLLRMTESRPADLRKEEADDLYRRLTVLARTAEGPVGQLAAALLVVLRRDFYDARHFRPPVHTQEMSEASPFPRGSEEWKLLSSVRVARRTALRLGLDL